MFTSAKMYVVERVSSCDFTCTACLRDSLAKCVLSFMEFKIFGAQARVNTIFCFKF